MDEIPWCEKRASWGGKDGIDIDNRARQQGLSRLFLYLWGIFLFIDISFLLLILITALSTTRCAKVFILTEAKTLLFCCIFACCYFVESCITLIEYHKCIQIIQRFPLWFIQIENHFIFYSRLVRKVFWIHWRLIWSQLLCATWFGLNIAGNANIPLLTGSEWGARILKYFDNPDLKYTKELKFQKHSDIATKIWRISNIFRYCSQYCYFGRSAWIFDWIWGNISAPVPTSDSLM